MAAATEQHARYLALAQRCRERAERAADEELAAHYFNLARGYEALARTFKTNDGTQDPIS
jgi:hypothetical protein